MIRLLNAEPTGYCKDARTLLEQLGELHEAPLSRTELLRKLPDYDVLIVRLKHQIDREVMDRDQRLKAIVTATIGLDHIDIDYAAEKGIAVLSLRGETEFLRTVTATAEHTWGLLLALLRRIPNAFDSVCRSDWKRDDFCGHELLEKRLGIVGLGRIGCMMARYGLAFGMQVGAYDPSAQSWMDGVRCFDTLSNLLKHSHVLSLHVPFTKETKGLIGKKELALLPRGAAVINTSRGEVLDEAALVQSLDSGHLSGAALDVVSYEREPEKRKKSALLTYACANDNLLITPHIAGATFESMAKTEVFMARKLEKFLSSHKGVTSL